MFFFLLTAATVMGGAAFAARGAPLAAGERAFLSELGLTVNAGMAAEVPGRAVIRKLQAWYRLTRPQSDVTLSEVDAFVQSNPGWPGRKAMQENFENSLRAEPSTGQDTAALVRWFDQASPTTASGVKAYARALSAEGRSAEVGAMVEEWWTRALVPRDQQRDIYKHFGTTLTGQAHRKRLDRLLWNKQYSNARGLAGVMGPGYRALVEARVALASRKANVNRLINKVPGFLVDDAGLRYERLRWRRRHKLNKGAVEILQDPPKIKAVTNPAAWWAERHILIRRMLEEGRPQEALALAKGHIQTTGFSYVQAQWVAGWLTLRYGKDPASAYARFQAIDQTVSTPISKGRALYWMGRAAEAMGDSDRAAEAFTAAAKYRTSYYGQKASEEKGQEISDKALLKHLRSPSVSRLARGVFKKDERVQIAWLFHRGKKRPEARAFMNAFIKAPPVAWGKNAGAGHDQAVYAFAVTEMLKMKDFSQAVRLAKRASYRGVFVNRYGYPLMGSLMRAAHPDVEKALIYAVVRQESQFDHAVKSRAGAMGLMQVMPATARMVAQQRGLTHDKGWLTQNPSHNIMLGSSYLHNLLERYQGAYPLAIAAYNAGPARVDRWLRTYGDPRTDVVDMLDWVELIPIYETRNYVQRVMEGVYVYRAILGRSGP